jgi:hypothetical protein
VFFSADDIIRYPFLRCNYDYQVYVMGHVLYIG